MDGSFQRLFAEDGRSFPSRNLYIRWRDRGGTFFEVFRTNGAGFRWIAKSESEIRKIGLHGPNHGIKTHASFITDIRSPEETQILGIACYDNMYSLK
ncbi:hypothetical protein TNCV_1033321 [Trichonephila clavipes]|nr:hypothetical protein TNCV_1033321 [Trichonephila clavipes]